MITANKGEWSEVYALFKLLTEGKLYAGDKDLNKIPDLIYPIISILRQESEDLLTYSPNLNHGTIEIQNGSSTFTINQCDLKEITEFLLTEIKKKQPTASFPIPKVERFISQYNSKKIKTKSSSKSDIRIIIYDQKIGTTPELGFSIKSKLGKPSTLLNASQATNFVYEVKNLSLTPKQIDDFNGLEFSVPIIQGRIQHLESLGATVDFSYTTNEIFNNNLILLDSLLPNIMAEALYRYYTSSASSLRSIFEHLACTNPMQYPLQHRHPFYEYKIKKLLCEIAIGMMPSIVWTGNDIDATGGYLVIKQDGDIVCYHLYHRHEFEEYLYSNTRFEAASKSRHNYGFLFTENGKLYMTLNLQIRFK
ncbi:HpaII family restriction endonuclease [Acinetobacter proteolyticus]|uniref:HpaII family restriction endonuclease n=1 Tax=Acinetobacter proteolyticus TaxID=1776741 RepID=UPI003D96150C